MESALRVQDYLDHILEAFARIQRYIDDLDGVAFLDNPLVQDAVIRNIEVIGEAANNIRRQTPEFALQHTHIPWEVIYAMRNRVAHGYFRVDLDLVWKTVTIDLPELAVEIQRLRSAG